MDESSLRSLGRRGGEQGGAGDHTSVAVRGMGVVRADANAPAQISGVWVGRRRGRWHLADRLDGDESLEAELER
eukprot:3817524-Prymnesium_polylepis.1